jgi:hypothetical protein
LIYNDLNLGELEPTGITLQLADMSIRKPLGMLEDVVLDVGSYKVPVDFLVLDMGDENRKSMILGRPFLATAGAIIDVREGTLTFRIGENRVEYRMKQTLNGPSEVHYVNSVDVIDEAVKEVQEEIMEEKELVLEEIMEVTTVPPKVELKPIPSNLRYAFL